MTTLTVNIDNKKSEKAVKAFLDTLGLSYHIEQVKRDASQRPLSKTEQQLFDGLKTSFEQIKLHQEGKIKLQDAKSALLEIEAEMGE